MNTYQHDPGAGFGVGMMTGLLVGAGLALLFAPKPGRELRGDLSESVAGARDAVEQGYRDVATKARSEFDAAREHVGDAAARVRDGVNTAMGSAAETVNRTTDQARRG